MGRGRKPMLPGPKTMVFNHYADGGVGRSVWIENDVADKLVKRLMRPARADVRGKPGGYLVRCYPK